MTTADRPVLRGKGFVAQFNAGTGQLVHLAKTLKAPTVVTDVALLYRDRDSQCVVSSQSTVSETGPSGIRYDKAGWTLAEFTATATTVTAKHRSAHLEVQMTYSASPDHPLLRVHSRVTGTGRAGNIVSPSMPRITFADDFNDAFEDERDLFFDGAELGGGRELPCWRVYFRAGYRTGAILATRRKDEMARFNILAKGFELWPHTRFNYSTSGILNLPPIDTASGKSIDSHFEIGPWTKAGHEKLLSEAKLRQVEKVESPKAKGKPAGKLKGKVFHAVKLAKSSQVAKTFREDRWMVARMPWSVSGNALFANAGVKPPAIAFNPGLKGPHRVLVGIGHSCGAMLASSGDPELRYRMGPTIRDTVTTTFDLALSGTHKPSEVDFGVLNLTGKTLRIGRLPSADMPATLDYVRCEPLSTAAVRRWAKQETLEPAI